MKEPVDVCVMGERGGCVFKVSRHGRFLMVNLIRKKCSLEAAGFLFMQRDTGRDTSRGTDRKRTEKRNMDPKEMGMFLVVHGLLAALTAGFLSFFKSKHE